MKGKLFWLGLLPAMLLLAGVAASSVQHGWLLWALTAVSMGVLVLMRVTTVSWFYSFMAVFYVLGCWFKVMVHHITDLPYVEPSGNFSGAPSEWVEYYEFALAIGLALLLTRVASLAFWGARRCTRCRPAVPWGWSRRHSDGAWWVLPRSLMWATTWWRPSSQGAV